MFSQNLKKKKKKNTNKKKKKEKRKKKKKKKEKEKRKKTNEYQCQEKLHPKIIQNVQTPSSQRMEFCLDVGPCCRGISFKNNSWGVVLKVIEEIVRKKSEDTWPLFLGRKRTRKEQEKNKKRKRKQQEDLASLHRNYTKVSFFLEL